MRLETSIALQRERERARHHFETHGYIIIIIFSLQDSELGLNAWMNSKGNMDLGVPCLNLSSGKLMGNENWNQSE
jgi:hypothetical protein